MPRPPVLNDRRLIKRLLWVSHCGTPRNERGRDTKRGSATACFCNAPPLLQLT